MSSGEEDVELVEKGGSETPGATPAKKGKEKEIKVDVKAYEESPPKDAGPNEFRYCQWFIDEKWRVIVEPPAGRKSGKTKGFVWKVDQKFSKKTSGKGEKRQESLVVSGFYLDAMLYKQWDIHGLWREHGGIKQALSKVSKTTDNRKSKRMIRFLDFSKLCRCSKQTP